MTVHYVGDIILFEKVDKLKRYLRQLWLEACISYIIKYKTVSLTTIIKKTRINFK